MKKYPANIEMYVGPMYSGKSTSLKSKISELVQQARTPEERPTYYRFTLDKVVEPKISKWKTHGGIEIEGYLINFFSQIDCQTKYILIDEVQFAFYHSEDSVEIESEKNAFFEAVDKKLVYLAGLNLDWQDNPFSEGTGYFMCIADKVNILKSKCHRCEKTAKFTEKITKNENRFDEQAEYLPICQECRVQEVSVDDVKQTIV